MNKNADIQTSEALRKPIFRVLQPFCGTFRGRSALRGPKKSPARRVMSAGLEV
jgi:hypothetical protein